MMKKKIFAAILALVISSSVLYGCKTESAPKEITIAQEGYTEYILVRPDESSNELWKAAGTIHKEINGECGEGTLEYTTDWVNRNETVPTGTKEILFGKTNRPESEAAYALIPDRKNNMLDFAILMENERIAIAGGSDEGLMLAANYFNENFVKDGKVSLPEGINYVYKHPFPEIFVAGNHLSEFTIVYDDDNHYLFKQAADRLNEYFDGVLGYTLEVCPESDASVCDKVIYLEYKPTLEYTASVTEDGDLSVTGVPESIEYAVSDYSEFTKLFCADATFEKGQLIASEDYVRLLSASSTKQTAAQPSDSDYGRGDYAYHIIDDDNVRHWSGLMSSWDFDGRGIPDKTTYYHYSTKVTDESTEEPVYLTRQITPQSKGIVTLETRFNCANDGAVIELCNEKGDHAFYIEFVDGKMCVMEDGNLKELIAKQPGTQHLKVITDFENKTNEFIYCNENLGVLGFSEECLYVDMLRFGVTPEKTGVMIPDFVKMYANYLVNERFIAPSETLECDANIEFDGGSCEILPNAGMNSSNLEQNSLEINASSFKLTKNFEKTSGKVIFEGKIIIPKRADGITFALTSDGEPAISVVTKNFGIFTGDGLLLRNYYSENVWHTIRIEADTSTGKAVIKMNGKVLDEVYLYEKTDYFDGIMISYSGEKPAHFWLDEVFCFAEPEFDDYVPEPVVADDDDYVVGLNICSLWREGTHSGWDKVSAYDEIKPLLGYYDEGVPEVQDWEIKWMTEHGIDFQLFCWYASSPDVPMMHTHLNDALMNGYMNARYSDKMKFALLWECANAARPQNSDDFRSNFIPYWVEHYLSDERYMSIDGNAVLAIFGAEKLINDLGGADKCRKEMDYFRDICRDLGYEGAIIMVCSGSQDAGSLKYLKSAGFDAVYAYNWGKSGYSTSHTEKSIRNQMNTGAIHIVPTLSTGFNNVGWAATRSPNMTVSDYDEMLKLFKNDLLKAYQNEDEEWKDSFIMLSTWNEYGEGTYIIPSGLNGFGYVDAVRENFGDTDIPHNDIVPTENQLARFTQMYSPTRHMLEPLYSITPELRGEKLTGFDFENSSDDRNGWKNHFGLSTFTNTGSSIDGSSSVNDFAIITKDIHSYGIRLEDIACIKVKMKTDKDSNATFFFTTEDDHQWNSQKSVSSPVTASEDYVEYIFDARNVSTWTGVLDELRFDPMERPGSFSIKSIDFYLHEASRVYINGNPVKNRYGYDNVNGSIYCAIMPQSNFPGNLGVAHRWDKDTKTITLYNANGSIRFSVGSDIAVTNVIDKYGFETDEGLHTETRLDVPVGEIDGLPVICINELADALGLDYELVDGEYIDIAVK